VQQVQCLHTCPAYLPSLFYLLHAPVNCTIFELSQQPQIPESYGRNKWPSCSCFADKSVFRVRMKPSENSDFSRKSSIQRQNHAPDCSELRGSSSGFDL
jgi:hypothetical protein